MVNGICSNAASGPRFDSVYGQIDAQGMERALVLQRAAPFGAAPAGERTGGAGILHLEQEPRHELLGWFGGPFFNSISGQSLFAPMRSLSDFNVNRSFVLSGTWEILVGQTPPLGGWQLGTVFVVSDGLPFTAVISGDALGQANQLNFDMPNRLSAPGCGKAVKRRNELVVPRVVNAYVSLFKNFALRFRGRTCSPCRSVQYSQSGQLRGAADQQQAFRHQGKSGKFRRPDHLPADARPCHPARPEDVVVNRWQHRHGARARPRWRVPDRIRNGGMMLSAAIWVLFLHQIAPGRGH